MGRGMRVGSYMGEKLTEVAYLDVRMALTLSFDGVRAILISNADRLEFFTCSA